MIHIGFDARLTHYRIGGISTYIRQMIQVLEQIDHENQYTILHSRKMRETLSLRFKRASLWTPAHHRFERLALGAEIARFSFDILHSTDFIPPLFGAKRRVITVHDLTFLLYPHFLTADSRRYYNAQIHAAVAQADHILTISQASKHDIIDLLHVLPEKITVQGCGVEAAFRPLPADVVARTRQRFHLPADYLLFVGTIEPRKNLITLAKAYRELLARFPDAPPLALVGRPGWHYDAIRSEIAGIGIEDHLLWRDNIPQEHLPAVYNGALALILPSYYEGFGLPPLEAMACGTVPIVSCRSSLPEVVGSVGLQFQPDDSSALAAALEHILTDSNWRDTMRAHGLERAAQFTWERSAQIALSVYHKVMK
ncbi:MAG: glycosyltransferase family 1 protein [bacterium]|nr:glycosyltransferase family 1 protein [bacterium]